MTMQHVQFKIVCFPPPPILFVAALFDLASEQILFVT